MFILEQTLCERGKSRRQHELKRAAEAEPSRHCHAPQEDLAHQVPEKAARLFSPVQWGRIPSNSTNSADKYLTIILAFFTPKRIFSCGPAVARTLAF